MAHGQHSNLSPESLCLWINTIFFSAVKILYYCVNLQYVIMTTSGDGIVEENSVYLENNTVPIISSIMDINNIFL